MNIIIIAVTPPPVNGMTLVTKSIVNELKKFNNKIIDLSFSKNTHDKKISWLFRRIRKRIAILIKLFFLKRCGDVAYVVSNSGYGLIFTALEVVLLKRKNINIILHHHTHSYIDKKFFLMSLIAKKLSKNDRQIFLCEKMRIQFEKKYGNYSNFLEIPNAFIYKNIMANPRKSLRNIGYISNITQEKGIDIFLNMATNKELKEVFFTIAGPIEDEEIKNNILQVTKENKNIFYLGSVYEDKKTDFFNSIDVLLFPTKYAKEAQPLVIWEAFRASVPVIATNKGCIPNLVTKNEGFCFNVDLQLKDKIFNAILLLKNNDTLLERLSVSAHQRWLFEKNNSQSILGKLLGDEL